MLSASYVELRLKCPLNNIPKVGFIYKFREWRIKSQIQLGGVLTHLYDFDLRDGKDKELTKMCN